MTRREEILGRALFEIFPDNPDDAEATGVGNLRASLDRVRRDRVPDTMAVQQYDIRRPEADGGGFEVRYWSPRNAPVFGADGNLGHIIHRVEDVTEFVQLKRFETEQQQQLTADLRQRNALMEHEILQRSKELQEANRQLRAADQAKREYLSRMSHELRTPLNAILGFAQLLEMDELQNEQRDSLGHILSGARHLLALINEVLDIAAIEAGQLPLSLEPVAVADVVAEAVSLIRPLADQHGILLGTPAQACADHVLGDRQRLKQILLNLLSNAVKYNRVGGSVRLDCEREPGERLRITVADTGTGIPVESIERLFEPFERLGSGQSTIEAPALAFPWPSAWPRRWAGPWSWPPPLSRAASSGLSCRWPHDPAEAAERDQPGWSRSCRPARPRPTRRAPPDLVLLGTCRDPPAGTRWPPRRFSR